MKKVESETKVETEETARIESDVEAESVKSSLTPNLSSNAGPANQSDGRETNHNMKCGKCSGTESADELKTNVASAHIGDMVSNKGNKYTQNSKLEHDQAVFYGENVPAKKGKF